MIRILAGASLLALAALWTWLPGRSEAPPPVVQPMPFDHRRHVVDEELACVDCHGGVEKGAAAGFPSVKKCLLCHDEEEEGSPAAAIAEHAARGEEIPWIQVDRVVGHVYFSHAMHVKVGGMECSECHGDVATRTEPVTAPLVAHLDMETCMGCHESRGASNDCLACHK